MSTSPCIALITGGNKGIGFGTAQSLAAQGYKAIIGSRDEKNGADAAAKINATSPREQAVSLQLDVASQSSVDAAAAFVTSKFGKLDALVNNAGVLIGFDTASTVALSDLKSTFDVNFFAQVYVSQKFLPLLKLSDAPRIVFVSSSLGSISKHADPSWALYSYKCIAYNASKAALNDYALHLAYDLKDSPFKVNTLHPGAVATDMNKIGGPDSAESAGAFVAKFATLPADGPTGGFFNSDGSVHAW